MGESRSATDINDLAWDPERDSATERRSLLRELDPLEPGRAWATFDPDQRTRGGQPLSERARLLLLGSTMEDLEILANEVNLAAEVDDDDEAAELAITLDAYEELLGRHRLLARDCDERTLARLPLAERREARRLQNRLSELRSSRYDGVVLRWRSATAAVARMERSLRAAEEDGNEVQAAEYRRLLELHRAELASVS